MERSIVLKEFEDADAILKGHFVLSSGLHSDTYMQCARVLMDAARAERLCGALALKVRNILSSRKIDIDMVVAPAMGGVVVGYEMGRQLQLPSIFCERQDGEFTIRRGFNIPEGANVLIVEDVITTGKSSIEAIECVKQYGGNPVAEACLVDRSAGEVDKMPVPVISLLELDIKTYDNNSIPDQLSEIPVTKPGSRWLK